MKFYYFDFEARGEVTRIMLRAAGREFDDVRFKMDEWASTYKAMSPTGQAPFLLCDDGEYLVQQPAIEGYVSELTGFQPDDRLAAARGWMLYHCYRDMWGAVAETLDIADVDEKIAARKKLLSEGGLSHRMLTVIEKYLAARTTEFAVADRPTLVDISLCQNFRFHTSGTFDGVTPQLAEEFPEIAKLGKKVAEHPSVAKGFVR